MTQTQKVLLYSVGTVLMSLPGLFTARMKWAFIAFLVAGCVILALATMKSRSARPSTALMLLVATNLSFWLSYGLWLLRLKFVGPSPESGIEAFAGSVALWLILFIAFLLYETVVFVRGVVINQERIIAALGLIGTVAQVLVTLRMAYVLVQGA